MRWKPSKFRQGMAYFGITATDAGLRAADGGDIADGLSRRLRRLGRAPVVVLVHGYRFHPGIAHADPHRSLFAFRPAEDHWKIRSWPMGLGFADDAGESGLGIGFAWPARASHLGSLLARRRTAFAEVYDRAGACGAQLAELVA